MNSAEDTVVIARSIMEHAMDAAGHNRAEARAKIAEMFADMIGFIAMEAFDEPDGRELLADIVKHASGARSAGDGWGCGVLSTPRRHGLAEVVARGFRGGLGRGAQ